MSRIQVLDKQVAELIAAGEVVQRPVSVVKELVENSIDAGATSITVEISHGGKSYIRVSDNGNGIPEEDLEKAFLRHSTSKISAVSDLDKIASLGFRGEALASIAAVSKIQVLSCTPDQEIGASLTIEGGEIIVKGEAGCPVGTTIVVRELFYNTPARMKFLRKDTSEGNAIASMLERLAICNPDISFQFIRNGSVEIHTPGDGKLNSTVYSVFGKEFSANLLPASAESGIVRVEGLVSKPEYSKSNRNMQNFFVNGRYVRSKICMVALEEAYRSYLMTGRHPACVLMISLPFDFVDVNVHPEKTEVRFSDDKMVFDAVYFACKSALSEFFSRDVTASAPSVGKEFVKFDSIQRDFVQKVLTTIKEPAELIKPMGLTDHLSSKADLPQHIGSEEPVLVLNSFNEQTDTIEMPAHLATFLNRQSSLPSTEQREYEGEDISPYSDYHVLSELFETYILIETKGKLILIDKHAAHERMIFNRLKSETGEIDRQMLLLAQTLDLSLSEMEILAENITLLEKLGFVAEPFGRNTAIIREIPVFLTPETAVMALGELLTNLENHISKPVSSFMDELFHIIACKSAIKAGDKTSKKELDEIVKMVILNKELRYCPHGRPVAVIITQYEIEKKFGRV